jgi:hypothetical protein
LRSVPVALVINRIPRGGQEVLKLYAAWESSGNQP